MLTTTEGQPQLSALTAEYDKAYDALVALAKRDRKKADKAMEHHEFERLHQNAEELFGFILYKHIYCCGFNFMAIFLKDAKRGRLTEDPRAHPDRLKLMATANGVLIKEAKDDSGEGERSAVNKSRSGAALLTSVRLYLFAAMMVRGDVRFLKPLPILAFLDVMQLVIAHPNITLDEAYQERDVCLDRVRELMRGEDGMSPNSALMFVPKGNRVSESGRH